MNTETNRMTETGENNQLSFWKSRRGILLQILIVLLPPLLFLESGTLLLAGVSVSVLLSWLFLKLQKLNWSDVGLKKPASLKRVILTALIATIILIPFTYALRRLIEFLTHQPPNLEAFNAVKNNPSAFVLGLVVAWIFGAFGEELLFRGFILNNLYKLLPDYFNRSRWMVSLVITSIFVGIGHAYQGLTGMILTGIIGFCFGLIYLKSKHNLWPNILSHGLYDTIAFTIVFVGFNFDQLFK